MACRLNVPQMSLVVNGEEMTLAGIMNSTLTHRQVDNVEVAILLFGCQLLRECASEESLQWQWLKYRDHWQRVLRPNVYFVLREVLVERLGQVQRSCETEPKQINMQECVNA